MNKLSIVICAAALTVSLLPSCSGSAGGGGQTVRYPSVSEMEDLERQWGMTPRQTRSKVGTETLVPVSPQPAAAPVAPQPLAPAPLQESTSPAAASQPAVDAATLQKLR